MYLKNILKKIFAVSVCVCLPLSACSRSTDEGISEKPQTGIPDSEISVFTDTPDSVTKNETVYVSLDSSGKVQEITVSDHIRADRGNVRIDDKSNLTEITDTKGNLTPLTDGEDIIWHSPQEDIYYSAAADKNSELPVTADIVYRLDNEEVKPEELAGKNGRTEIEIKFKNKISKTVTTDGKAHTVYLPVLVAGMLSLPESSFSDISVENARLIGDASKQTAVFTLVPFAGKSLGSSQAVFGSLGKLLDSDYVKITADVENFSLGNIYFTVIPFSSLNLDLEPAFAPGDLQTLLGTLGELGTAFNSLDPEELISALAADPNAIDELIGVAEQASVLYNQNQVLIELFMKYMTGENSKKISAFLNFLGSEETMKALEAIASPQAQEFLSQIPELQDSLEILIPLAKDLSSPEIKNVISALPQTVKNLQSIKTSLENNKDTINALEAFLSAKNTASIKELLGALKSSDLSALSEQYSPLSQDARTVMALAEQWLEFGESYRIFSDAAPNTETSVAFIFKTPSI